MRFLIAHDKAELTASLCNLYIDYQTQEGSHVHMAFPREAVLDFLHMREEVSERYVQYVARKRYAHERLTNRLRDLRPPNRYSFYSRTWQKAVRRARAMFLENPDDRSLARHYADLLATNNMAAPFIDNWPGMSDIFVLADCGHVEERDEVVHSEWHGRAYCDECQSELTYSEVMGDYIEPDVAIPIFDTMTSLQRDSPYDYAALGWLRRYGSDRGLTYAGSRDRWVTDELYEELRAEEEFHDDDDDDDEDSPPPRRTNRINEYHDQSTRGIGRIDSGISRDPLLFGLELEFMVSDPREYNYHDMGNAMREEINACARALGVSVNSGMARYCCAEEDGSLTDGNDDRIGFEIITSYGPIDAHRRIIEKVFARPTIHGVEYNGHWRTGIHVHISSDRAPIAPLHRGKLAMFIHSRDNEALIKDVARRYNANDYARIKHDKRITDGLHEERDDRYEALNFETLNRRTVEFRLFAGSGKAAHIMTAVEFAHAAWSFTEFASHRELSTKHFIHWLNLQENKGTYPTLRTTLRESGFAVTGSTVAVPLASLLAA